MTPAATPLRSAAVFCADCLVLLACWTLWLALGALLAAQITIAVSHEFALPGWMLRTIEQRFAASHLQAKFGRATFSPSGAVVLENLRLSLPEFEEPVVRARAVYVDLDPWLALAGILEPRQIHATGISLFVPGMLAPSGHNEEIVRDLELTLKPGDNLFDLDHFGARIAGVALTAHGSFQLPGVKSTRSSGPLPLLTTLATHYADFSRQLLRLTAQLAPLDQPEVDLRLAPSPTRGAIAHVVVTARRLTLPQFHDLSARELRATARFPLFGETPALSPLALTADEIRFGDLAVAHGVVVRLRGALNPGKFTYVPREIELSARDVSARGFAVDAVAARIEPRPLPQFDATLIAFCAGLPAALSARADFAAQTATVHFDGVASPDLLDPISATIHHDVRRFVDFGEPVALNVTATFGPGWKFQRVAGHAAMRRIDAYRVPIDAAHGEIEFDGRHFIARHAFASLGESYARGSFEQDLKTKAFRFLLEGRLRPLAISGWFHGDWWPGIFSYFEFPDSPPGASVDVSGRWFTPGETAVFLFAESRGAIVRGAKLDYARTLLFIRPHFLDGLELFATRDAGEARGTFTRLVAPEDRGWSKFTFSVTSSLDLVSGGKLLGPALAPHLAPYTFAQPPQVTVTGDFDGPGAGSGEHQNLQIAARSTGRFSFYRFPAENLSFTATLHDGDLAIDHLRAEAAGGVVTGHARVWGPEANRRLGFDGALNGANLQRAVTAVTAYAALRRGDPTTAAEKILTGKAAARLDLALSAEGRIDDPYSYHGNGHAVLAGELGQVRLLGLLSELLNFTALRFTNARADFTVQGPKITFPSVSVTGANSAIAAHGDYLLDRHELDFNARVYPFQESKSLLQSVVGVVLTPFSAVLEVKLTGPLDQPRWAFVIGPTNFFRSLSTSPTPPPTPAPTGQPPASLRRDESHAP